MAAGHKTRIGIVNVLVRVNISETGSHAIKYQP